MNSLDLRLFISSVGSFTLASRALAVVGLTAALAPQLRTLRFNPRTLEREQ